MVLAVADLLEEVTDAAGAKSRRASHEGSGCVVSDPGRQFLVVSSQTDGRFKFLSAVTGQYAVCAPAVARSTTGHVGNERYAN